MRAGRVLIFDFMNEKKEEELRWAVSRGDRRTKAGVRADFFLDAASVNRACDRFLRSRGMRVGFVRRNDSVFKHDKL